MITLSKKSGPGKFAIPCVVKGVEFPHSMCDTGASVKYESEYETEYSESIDTHTFPSIDSNESTVTDDRNNTSLDVDQPVDHFALPNHCYPHFAFQPPSKRGRDDYSIGSWADSGFHESFAVDTDPDGKARAIDGSILQVYREDIADILQVANGPDNQFSQQRGTPDVIQTDPNKHVGVAATKINPNLSGQPKGQASIDGTTQTSIDRITPTSTDKDDPTSIDRRYEFGNRAYDMYRARKFTWE
ncbi:hypothetical protein DY000_02061208 [Brassica cretica]|uniref:Uncharacterized protein n=1 Tax=Brassica cretica TaxID=69181 RepID=A0ABQ7B413_BRACR|nr:hypothetical protein DY000_02061208 [Brassica cretica]